jgi:N-acetylglucosamine malate deacetylase 2
VPDINEALGRTLIIVAHADDEAVACGALLQRMRDPVVAICTDGAPRDAYFWQSYGSRAAYARYRADEARAALHAVGVTHVELLSERDSSRPLSGDLGAEIAKREADDAFVDQELFRQIPQAMERLLEVAQRMLPDCVLTLAYEGGHPDHDTCNFLGRQLSDRLHIPVWEAPLYHRFRTESMTVQRFLQESGQEIRLAITDHELVRKAAMFASYASQREVLDLFDPRIEIARPMRRYDYSRPPHEGTLNYEAWGWRIRGWELCDQFTQYLNAERGSALDTHPHKKVA